jgi:DNA polymerase I
LLDYSQSHVDATVGLLRKMLPSIDLPRAVLRGRYMAAAARVERNGVPIDMPTLSLLRKHWDAIKTKLIGRVDADYGVYENGSFRVDRWAKYLVEKGIRWPHLPSGELALDGDTFSKMAKLYPEQVGPIRELRHAMGQLRLNDLAVGTDGRNRCSLAAFRSKTGRNQPSTSRFIFGPACWMRSLIKPDVGRAVAYVDWCQQEFGIAAALSGDKNMMEAYASGDPYLTFAKQAGAVPANATKKSHPTERGQFKVCALAVQYGMGEKSLGQTLGESPAVARELLQLHHQTYPNFWLWSEAAVDHAMLHGCLQTVFDWRIHAGSDANPRSLANFPCQANGAEMLRLACCLATERGINVCAPVHDAVLIEDSIEDIDEVVRKTQEAMREASEVILRGFSLRTEADIVRWPHRYVDERGVSMWRTVTSILSEMESSSPLKTAAYPGTQPPTSPATICCPGQSYIKSIRE